MEVIVWIVGLMFIAMILMINKLFLYIEWSVMGYTDEIVHYTFLCFISNTYNMDKFVIVIMSIFKLLFWIAVVSAISIVFVFLATF